MAQSGSIIQVMAKAAGYKASTVERIVRDLQNAGMAPLGTHGRGKHLGQFTPTDMANVVLAFGGLLPSEAAEAARLLGALVYRGTITDPAAQTPYMVGSTLNEVVARMIVMEAVARGWVELQGVPPSHLPACVDLCLSPPGAVLTWDFPDGTRRSDLYGPPAGAGRGVERRTILHRGVLVAAAELWSDTTQWRPDLTPDLGASDEDGT